MVSGSIPGGVTGDFFRSYRRNHVSWGRLSFWKLVPGISPGLNAACAYGWRPTTLVVPNVKKIRGLSLPWNPWATSACCGLTFTFLKVFFVNFILLSPRRKLETEYKLPPILDWFRLFPFINEDRLLMCMSEIKQMWNSEICVPAQLTSSSLLL